jgi:hypothetical protein
MTETSLDHPAEPTEEGIDYGGFAAIAARLNALHPERPKPFSRQLVARWFKCRGTNKMPDRQPVEVGGKTKLLFDLEAVELWHATEHKPRPQKGSREPIETIPLFRVDPSGRIVA